MMFITPEKNYEIIVTYKNNKNMYLRVKNDLKIYITAPKYVREKDINKFIESNYDTIYKCLIKYEKKKQKEDKLLYLGKEYDIIYLNSNSISFGNNKVFLNKNINIDNFYRKEAKLLFKEHLNIIYNNFEENIPYPSLKIRKMTSRWGVCNTKLKIITLNLELMKKDVKYLDYVIVHELCHLIYPNHQKEFWNLVSKYVSDYKIIRKEMRD